MLEDPDACYRALAARDRRFDGVFFVGVRSTGIYCRPVCPARTPRRDGCTFFADADAAERAGYRPCLRCRPERAPGMATVDAASHLAARALARIEQDALGPDAVRAEERAERLGVGARHLRRVVREAFGRSPRDLAQSFRLQTARRLLVETDLPVGRVAIASGYGSERRFRDAFRQRYGSPPSDLRRRAPRPGKAAPDGDCPGLRLELAYRPPLAFAETLRFFAFHVTNGVDAVVDTGNGPAWIRSVSRGGHSGTIRVTHDQPASVLVLEVPDSLAPVLGGLVRSVRDAFDLDARPDVVDAALGRAEALAPLVAQRPGLRLPGAFDRFETAARIVLGQQVSVRGAMTLATRFAIAFGERLGNVHDGTAPDASGTTDCAPPHRVPKHRAPTHCAPTPARVADADPDMIASAVGIPRTRARCLHALAASVADDPRVLEISPSDGAASGEPVDAARRRLLELPGIGPWTAELILMRCGGWPDALPAADLVLMQRCGVDTPREMTTHAEPWRPWRSYATMHVWANALDGRPLPATPERTTPNETATES